MRRLISRPYYEARDQIQSGDLVFFEGKGLISGIIRTFTGRPSHVACVYQASHGRIELIESTTLNRFSGKRGVQATLLSDRLDQLQPGEAAFLAILDPRVRAALSVPQWERYLRWFNGRPYDFAQAIGSALGQWIRFLPSLEAKRFIYCSELASGALRAAGAIPPDWDPTPTPHQMARWDIFSQIIQVAGDPIPFPDPDPQDWSFWDSGQIAANRP